VFVAAHVGLGATPLAVARQGLAAYASDPAALRHDSEVALRTGLDSSDGRAGSVMPIDVLSAPVRHHAGVTMMPVRWVGRAAPSDEMPLLDATVQVIDSGTGTVELAAVASYRPPSPAPDAEAVQRVAERMLRTLPLGVATTIRSAASDGSAAPS
jgi:hypothetical protein